ncbi:MAG: DegT/DnrJ/EryC1/StrS family aminotransferase, partial [archaeon]|nr:DegT/DnrJ/EryC1/StrS family aminotransferase [archaeon]
MKIPLCKMYVDNEIKSTVNDIIDAGWYINGPHVKAFEKEFSEYIGVKNAIAVNSGTSALFTTFLYLGIKPGDEIIVPSHTFIASITPAIILGAKPIFVDINPENYTMDVSQVREKITEKTKAIVCVHIYGHPVDMDPILEIAHQHEIIVIEDCAQAHGSLYKNNKIGKIGDIGCFSFFPSKIMTVGGDGGMIVTENAEI